MSPLLFPPARLEGFPRYRLLPTTPLFRIHRRHHEPWWLSSGTPQRFDLAPQTGTCYLSETGLGAFVEVFRDFLSALVPGVEIAARRLSTLSVPRTMTLADCTAARAARFGVTAEIHSGIDRDLTRAWARAFAAARFDGVRYLVRHDPAQRHVGVALFGDASETDWPVASTENLPATLLHVADRSFGIRIG